MKTINTVLPIYDKLSKQCYERAKHAGMDEPVPVITPRFKLPSFQFTTGTTDMGEITNIELIDREGNSVGDYNPFSNWTNGSFDTLTSSGLNITLGITSNLNDYAQLTQSYTGVTGDVITVTGTFTSNSGGIPMLQLYSGGYTAGTNITCVPGEYTYTFTLPGDGTYELRMWGVPGAGVGNFSFTGVTISITDFGEFFDAFPAQTLYGTDYYYIYEGDTLNYLMPEGLHYLKITTDEGYVFYSDWFLVDCIPASLITSFTNVTYETFSTSGTTIINAVNTVGNGEAYGTEGFQIIKDKEYTVIFYAVLNSGQAPTMSLVSAGLLSNEATVTAGLNVITLTATANDDLAYLFIDNDAAANFALSEIIIMESFSDKYLQINFSHTCNLGGIIYEDGFTQVLYLETETMEPTFPYTEKGQENGYGQFVPTFQRQDKLYLIRTGLIPQHIVDVLHRLKLHDTVTLTDLVGDSFTVKEIDTEHEWQFQDRYYAIATVTVNLGEDIVITGCCTAINECE